MRSMRIWQRLFSVQHHYDAPIDRQRATGLLWMSWVGAIGWLALIAVLVITGRFSDGKPFLFQLTLVTIVPPFALPAIFFFIQRGSLRAAVWAFIGLLVLMSVPEQYDGTGVNLLPLTLPLVAAGVLLNRSGILLVAVLVPIGFVVGAIIQNKEPFQILPHHLAFIAIILAVNVAFLYIFAANVVQLVGRLAVSTDQIERITRFSTALGILAKEDTILAETLELVRNQLGYDFAQIFLVDQQGQLERRVRRGLGVDLVSVPQTEDVRIVAETVHTRQVQVATQWDAAIRRQHMLPAMRVGVAIPLIIQDTILGVLDVQSEHQTEFTPTEIGTLGLLANQIAMLLSYTRNVAGLQQSLQTQEQATDNLRTQLHQLQRVGSQNVGEAWADYLRGQGSANIGFDIAGIDSPLIPAHNLPDTLRPILESGELAIIQDGDKQIVNVPIVLQDEVLGAMSFTIPANTTLTERQLDMLQTISSRLALSLETKRLFDQSQAQALRESKATEITSQLMGATDVKMVLDMAAASFNEALGAIRTHIFLKPDFLAEDELVSEDTMQ